MSKEKYILEYWIDSSSFTKKRLEQKLSIDLNKLETKFKIDKEGNYYVLWIKANEKNIDACHGHLNFKRQEFFRAKDELGDELRLRAYPVLAEIETQLRQFISRAMIEVLGFNWWDRSTPKNVRENVDKIEGKAGAKQAEEHHQIEFTMFDDLIELVTGKYQVWPDAKNITSKDLSNLLSECNLLDDLKKTVNRKRETTSLWEDVFSNYFDDKEAWNNLKSRIRDVVIPIRNKVMHHRQMRLYELRQLKECKNEVNNVVITAKSELSSNDYKQALQDIKTAFESIQFQLDPKLIKALSQPIIDPAVIKRLQQPIIDPSIIRAMQKPIIDPEKLSGIIPRLNFGVKGPDDKKDSDENEKEPSDENGKDDDNGSENNTNGDEE